MDNSEQKNSKVLQYIIFGIILTITLVVLIHYFFFLFGGSISPEGINTNFYMDNNITLEKKGVFGDFTSGHFSILAFIWLAYGIFIQSREFKLQRDEFENQTEQFIKQNELYAQQMKELEIQSIQNQFDRKLAKLTEIEKTISNRSITNNDIYVFMNSCKQNIGLNDSLQKIDSIEKYIFLYDDLNTYVINQKDKIDLTKDLLLLKKDIYDGLKVSFMLLLFYLQGLLKRQEPFILTMDKVQSLMRLKIYKTIQNTSGEMPLVAAYPLIKAMTKDFKELDQINIFDLV